MLRIEMLPAGHGDSLLLEYGDAAAPHRVLIDAGPFYAYKSFARRISDIAGSGQRFELFVITHVDTDHIDGAIKLLGAAPSGIDLRDVWFNGWRHLLPGRTEKRGPVQGEMLQALLEDNRLPWNAAFQGDAVSVKSGKPLPVKPLDGGLTLTLLSPEWKELINLNKAWETEVIAAGLEPGSREKALDKLRKSPRYRPRRAGPPDIRGLAAQRFEEERSKTNASSIAFLAEYGGKTCLFAADAQPYRLVDSIQALLRRRGERRLKVDVVKLSHHGSRGNTSPELLSLLDCKHFLISTNGGGGFKPPHPHDEAIARVIEGCGPGVELWFNYCTKLTDPWDNAGLMQQHHYKAHYPEEGQEGLVVPVSEL
jgi:beta-lactamase superfamily II metal-dependent hydrolase